MEPKYLLDTNVVIDFAALKLPQKAYEKISSIIDSFPQISIVNKIKLLSFSNVPDQVEAFIKEVDVINLDDAIVAKTIDIRKKYKLKLPDAVIAATAVVMNLSLVTHNISDFNCIKGLKLVDSYSLS
ncbi:type II toxin-antitoxin system VapC family toxin [Mucilaginibacter flavus]|uniref:type II toxin-antitoxin system VapC family toxin n=1 Tax=Mucilaginibacter flavus TaxID=931504 RepID=UPI0025B43CB4|nr:type II toxin-antitoxin system VapC family toxin [Mucilaginibacter flavus]MDN3581216.1 type II toxin-antitoxin system VapC family toxin [Mucilaginibacter flavus]